MATRLNTTGSKGYTNVQDRTYRESSGSKRIPMFNTKGASLEFLNGKTEIKGVILPAFDPTLNENDASRPVSYGSYRDMDAVNANGDYELSAWSVSVEGYNFMGNSMQTFISPSILRQDDPIIDLRKYIYNLRKDGDETYMNLVERPAKVDWREFKLALPGTQTMVLINFWGTGGNAKADDVAEKKNRVLMLKPTAWGHLMDDLNKERPASVRVPRDPEHADYLLGDVTHPDHALEFTTKAIEAKGRTGNTFQAVIVDFGNLVAAPGGGKQLNCKEVTIPENILAGRLDLADCDNVLHIPTYDEIVEMLIEDGMVPFELINLVCGPKCSKPLQPKEGSAGNASPEARPANTAAPVIASSAGPELPPPPASITVEKVAVEEPKMPSYLREDDPEDDIPYGDSASQDATTGLTPAEEVELEEIMAKLKDPTFIADPVKAQPVLARMTELMAKKG